MDRLDAGPNLYDCRGFFSKRQRDFVVRTDIYRDLAAICEATEQQLVGQCAANRILN